MKSFLIFLIFLLSCFYNISFGQNRLLNISGRIVTASETAEKLVVSLKKGNSENILKSTLTDKSGNYILSDITQGQYQIFCSVNGYKEYISASFEIRDSDVIVPDIHLTVLAKTLSSVNLVSKKSLYEIRPGKILMNVESSPSFAGESALEVLDKSPGVSVDKDGNISLKGKSGVAIYVDGKPTELSGSELATLLRGMSSTQIDQIEIMTMPSAKYSAEGNAGIINIKSRKLKGKGFNATLNLGYGKGFNHKNNESVLFNYKTNKLNFFGTIASDYAGTFYQFYADGYGYDINSHKYLLNLKGTSEVLNQVNASTIKAGLDYDINKRNSITFTFNQIGNFSNLTTLLTTPAYDDKNVFLFKNIGNNYSNGVLSNKNLNGNFKHLFDTSGTEINIDASLVNYGSSLNQNYYNRRVNEQEINMVKPDSLYSSLPNGFNIWAIKSDFITKFGRKLSFEEGLKMSETISDNNSHFDSLINGTLTSDVRNNNHFKYSEKIYAGYAVINYSITNNLKLQTGIRYEKTDGKGVSLTNGDSFVKRFNDLFPNINLSFDLDKNNSFNFLYAKRIERPKYNDLNPLTIIYDKFTIYKGNPSLNPVYGNNFEFSHTYKGHLTTTLNYSHKTGAIFSVMEEDPVTFVSTLIHRNIGLFNQIGISVNYSKSLSKGFTLSSNIDAFRVRCSGSFYNYVFDKSRNTVKFRISGDWALKQGWNINLTGNYSSQRLNGFINQSGSDFVSVSGSKLLFGKRGKISLNIRDPFQMYKYSQLIDLGYYIEYGHFNYSDFRYINMTFSYKLGKQFKTKAKRESSSSEEMQRVG